MCSNGTLTCKGNAAKSQTEVSLLHKLERPRQMLKKKRKKGKEKKGHGRFGRDAISLATWKFSTGRGGL